MKLWQAFAIIVLSFVVVGVVGGGSPPSAVADSPQSRGVNARIEVAANVPRGARHLFGDWYHLDSTDGKAAIEAVASAVEPDYVATIASSYLESSLLNQVSAPPAWNVTQGAGVTIAILDTGVDCTHPALRGRCTGDADVHGHGTHVAGLAAGIALGASIRSYRVMDANGGGQFSVIAQGITQAASDGARIENLSLGCPACYSQMMQDAINTAERLGVVVVAAAGNDGTSTPSIPAYYASLAVAAVDSADHLASFSNFGSWVNVAAPGVDLLSTCRGGSYCRMTGTSMAAPVAAGVAALASAAHPGESVDSIAGYVMAGDPISGQTFRRVNAVKAVGASGGGPIQPTSTPLPGRATATPQAGDYGAQLISLVNDQRRAVGLAALGTATSLNAAAAYHNAFMVSGNCFAHQCPGEADPGTRATSNGYPSPYIGENIAAGYVTPTDTVNAWMNSAGHKANILGNFTDVGCAYAYAPGTTYGTYWTCDFGSAGVGSQPQPQPTPRPLPTMTPTARPAPVQPTATATIPTQPGGRGPMPPSGYVFRVELSPWAGWAAWDNLYYEWCSRPFPGVTCSWVRQ